MQSCSIHHTVLFIILTLNTAPVSAAVCSTTVKLHQSVSLPCHHKCTASAKWTLKDNRDVVFARCDQTSCGSMEGYTISYDQYLKGDLSLTITTANHTQRNTYVCECGFSDISTLHLSIDTLLSSVQKKSGEDLTLELFVSEPVEVIYKSEHTDDGEWMCNVTQRDVTERSLLCNPKYTPRASVTPSHFTLRGVTLSDGGSYTIRDMKNKEDICVYSVIVTDMSFPWWGIVLVLLLVLLMLTTVIGLIKYRKYIVHNEFIKVCKQLEHVNKLTQQAGCGKAEAPRKAEAAIRVLEQWYTQNPKYRDQIKIFCEAKRAQLKQCRGEEQERLLWSDTVMIKKMEEVFRRLQQLRGDAAGHFQCTNTITEAEAGLSEIEQWCTEKKAELNGFRHRGGEHAGTCGGPEEAT